MHRTGVELLLALNDSGATHFVSHPPHAQGQVTSWPWLRSAKKTTRGVRFKSELQYIPRNLHTVFALLCFVVVIYWLIFPYPSGLLHWHCGNLTIAPVPAKQPWWIWINTSCEFIMNDCITTTKQSTTKPCAYFLGYTVCFVTANRVHIIWDTLYDNVVDVLSVIATSHKGHGV